MCLKQLALQRMAADDPLHRNAACKRYARGCARDAAEGFMILQRVCGRAVASSPAARCCRAIKYLYDGDCAMCQSLKTVLERQVGPPAGCLAWPMHGTWGCAAAAGMDIG